VEIVPVRVLSVPFLIFVCALCVNESHAQASFSQTGVASYYGRKFHGRTTANGERFNMWAMTAAHKTIPFDTRVRVTNLDNNKSVVVRINDYGPFSKGRIIDLSRGAAAKIGMIQSGTARVKLEVLAEDVRDDHLKSKGNTEYYRVAVDRQALTGWAVQVASFEKLENMIRLLDRLSALGIDNAYVQLATVNGKLVHRIVIGGYDSEEGANWKLKTLKEQGIDGFVFVVR
jgi:rare lipoprotein A